MHFRPAAALIVLFLSAPGCQQNKTDKAVAAAARNAAPSAPAPVASPPHAAPTAPHSAAAGSAAAPAASAPAEKSATTKPAATPAGPEVKLLSAGAEPRRALRYHFQKGHVEKFKLTSSTSMTVKLGDQAMPAPAIPTLEMIAAVKIVSVAPDGTAKRDLTIEKVQLAEPDKVPAAMRGTLEDSLGEMAKLKGHDTMDSHGRLLSSRLDTSALDNGEVKQMMQAMASAFGEVSAPFPDEPVGKGARWQVSTEVEQLGMKMKQQATYTLVKLDGDKGTTNIQLKQSAPGSHIQIPGVPLDVQSDLLGMTGSGKGEMQFDLARSLPKGSIATQSDVKVRTHVPGRTQDTQIDMNLTEQFTPM